MGLRDQLARLGLRSREPGNWDAGVNIAKLFVGGVETGMAPITGRTLYVDPTNGDDSNVGTLANAPFKKLSVALANLDTTTNAVNLIWRMPGSSSDETAQIEIDQPYTIIAAAPNGMTPYQPEFYATYPAASYTTGPMLKITARCAIIGVMFETRWTAGESILTYLESPSATPEYGYFCYFSHMRFIKWWSKYGMRLNGGSYCAFDDCYFGGLTAGILYDSNAVNNPVYNEFRRCYFAGGTDGILIDAGTTPQYNNYEDCVFYGQSNKAFNGQNTNAIRAFINCRFPGHADKDAFMDQNTAAYTSTLLSGNVFAD